MLLPTACCQHKVCIGVHCVAGACGQTAFDDGRASFASMRSVRHNHQLPHLSMGLPSNAIFQQLCTAQQECLQPGKLLQFYLVAYMFICV